MSAVSAQAPRVDVVHLRHEQTSGTMGGTASAGAWTKATINTEALDTGDNCSLVSSVFTLQTGTYEFTAWQTVRTDNCGASRLRLRNTSDGVTIKEGMSHSAPAVFNSILLVRGRFTITAAKNFELQYYVASSAGVSDLGNANSTPSTAEVYADIYMRKVA